MARLARRARHRLPAAPADRRFEDYNLVLDAAASGLGIALARPPLTEQKLGGGPPRRRRQAHVLNPVSYWLDRPQGRPRPAAAELSRRIGMAAGLDAGKLDAFLNAAK